MPQWLFFFLAALAVVSASGVILQRNPVHCLLGLAVNLLVFGVIFIGLGAVTVGFLQIIIYVGAILVLFLFVIWLLNVQAEGFSGHLGLKLFGAFAAAALAAELAAIFIRSVPLVTTVRSPVPPGSIASLGRALFSNYLIGFEVTSVLLLAAIVGAIGLARRVPSSPSVPAESSGDEQASSRGVDRPVGRGPEVSMALSASAGTDRERREHTSV
jgi:NADH-quinone oxidoreductase subunit J